MAKKVICSVCGYVFEDADNLPDVCPQCKAPKSKFAVKDDAPAASWADEHKIGVAARPRQGSRRRAAREFHGRVHGSRNVSGDEQAGRQGGVSGSRGSIQENRV